jgi:tRNA nucleotidyltransferase (CCA-adding enzyme)
MLVLQAAAAAQAPLSVRWACLMHDLGKARTPAEMLPRHIGHEARSVRLAAAVADRLRVPAECAELAAVVAAEHGNVHRSLELGAAATLRLLQRCDALRRPQRFELVLQACRADHLGRGGDWPARPYPQEPRLLRAQRAALAVDAGAVAHEAVRNGATAQAIAQAVARAREQAIEREERGGPASD